MGYYSEGDRYSLSTGNSNYNIDEFSNTGLAMLYNNNVSSAAFITMPAYSNQLIANTALKAQTGLHAEFLSAHKATLYYTNPNQLTYACLKNGLTYVF